MRAPLTVMDLGRWGDMIEIIKSLCLHASTFKQPADNRLDVDLCLAALNCRVCLMWMSIELENSSEDYHTHILHMISCYIDASWFVTVHDFQENDKFVLNILSCNRYAVKCLFVLLLLSKCSMGAIDGFEAIQ